jgi:hypothetical protein
LKDNRRQLQKHSGSTAVAAATLAADAGTMTMINTKLTVAAAAVWQQHGGGGNVSVAVVATTSQSSFQAFLAGKKHQVFSSCHQSPKHLIH